MDQPEPGPQGSHGATFRGEDWYGEDLGGARHVESTFIDVDLSEARSSGTVFERCVFAGVRFNSSVHRASAFVTCEFEGSNLFDATFDGCKMTGSAFVRCTMRPMKVSGGQWRGVSLCNLTSTVLRGATLDGVDLAAARLRRTRLDLAGALLLAELHGAVVDVP